MKTKRLLSALALACLLPLSAWADVYQDPKTKVNYEYTPGSGIANVKAGSDYYKPGTENLEGEIAILPQFTVDGQEYWVKSIGDYAFSYSCTGMTKVELPEGIETIGIGAFYQCSAMTTITIPSSVIEIGHSAFHSSGLTDVTIPNSVTHISNSAFSNCANLTNIDIPNSVTSIAGSAFSGCRSLTSVTIPKSVVNLETDFYGYAFHSCISLSTIVVEEGNPVYDSRDNCNAIIETATNKLIGGCNGTTIPSSVTEIGRSAFCGSGITSIYIPSNVTKIADWGLSNPFLGCMNLESIVVDANNEVFDSRNNCNAVIKESAILSPI